MDKRTEFSATDLEDRQRFSNLYFGFIMGAEHVQTTAGRSVEQQDRDADILGKFKAISVVPEGLRPGTRGVRELKPGAQTLSFAGVEHAAVAEYLRQPKIPWNIEHQDTVRDLRAWFAAWLEAS